MRSRIFGFILILMAVATAGICLYVYWPKIMDYKKARDLYDDIENTYTSPPDDEGTPSGEPDTEDISELINDERQEEETEDPLGEPEIPKMTLDEAILSCGVARKDVKKYYPLKVNGRGLKKENGDYIGWIYIPGTNISYPCVRSKDNEDYLHRNFKKEYNFPGTIFLDARCRYFGGRLPRHAILYGHNMRDGSMFANIKQYNDQRFANNHPLFYFITEDRVYMYRVFSSYVSEPKDPNTFGVYGEQFEKISEWKEAIGKIKANSVVKSTYDVSEKDYCLTLSTCTNERVTRSVCNGALIWEGKEYNTDSVSKEVVELETKSEPGP